MRLKIRRKGTVLYQGAQEYAPAWLVTGRAAGRIVHLTFTTLDAAREWLAAGKSLELNVGGPLA